MFVNAIAHHDLHSDGWRESYLWGELRLVEGSYQFHLASGSQNSGNLMNLAQTTGLAVMPVGQTFIPAGESVLVLQVICCWLLVICYWLFVLTQILHHKQ